MSEEGRPFVQTVNDLTESICSSSSDEKQCRSDMERIIVYSFVSGWTDLDCHFRSDEIKESGDAKKIRACDDAANFISSLRRYEED